MKQGESLDMIRLTSRALCTLSAVLLLTCPVTAEQEVKAEQMAVYDLLPNTTQAIVWIQDGDQLAEQWKHTQLHALASDEAVAPFFEEQRQEIEQRLVDAGWRLNVRPEDLSDYSIGQIGLAWLELPAVPRKPFAMALIADLNSSDEMNDQLFEKIESELTEREAQKTLIQHLGVEIAKYTLPKRVDALLAEESFYAIVDKQFLSTDDEQLIKDMISRIRGEAVSDPPISSDPVFIEGREKLGITGAGQIEYFVRPLGFARVLRAIGGKRSKSNADMLAVLQNQGFDAIRCVCGEIMLGLEQLDISHRGYVLAPPPLPKSAGILDFPNKVSHDLPSFIGKNISSVLATNWNAKEAFWRTEGLVDELAGTPGVFAEVVEGIKKDPNGPRIDIRQDVLPHFTNDIYSITDSKEGETDIDSRRNLIALRLNNPKAMAKVLDRAMRNEPDAELVQFEGHAIWKVVHREDEEVIDLTADFGDDFGAPPAQSNQPQPWLSNWAITVYDDYLMFASHVEMIRDSIVQANAATQSPLLAESDYERVTSAITEHFGPEIGSAWQIVRNSLAYRVQYELFREGKLRQSQSMLASILDRLLQNEAEMRGKEQKVSGTKLPPFDQISHFLQPSGMMMRSTEHGWEFGSVLLARQAAAIPTLPTDLNATNSGQGTARISNSEAEAKR
jgi:hypothetical protein